MGLYDGVRQSNNEYMSQYVGSIVPELSKYSEVVQDRYNKAADSDDALTEALGNLQHLSLDVDTQYANELKETYYTRLQDRANRSDFENMGRRTRRDAIQFSQAYMPLVQRQKDFAEIVKKVNSDANIADPQKKQQILGYIQNMNSSNRGANGDFERDAAGRPLLNSIQDWAYAKDVDINKKLTDLLSKKETDIRQSGFSSDGQGLKISSVQELRSPAMMAKLAREMMATDPEIKAMLQRDVTLNNYRLSPEDVRTQLKQVDKSPYQLAKEKGLSDKEIAVYAKSQGATMGELKTSNLQRQREAYMSQGMSAEAADRAVLNKMTEQQMMAPHINLVANLLAVDKRKIEAREDGMLLLNMRRKMELQDKADNERFQVLTTPVMQATEVDPARTTKDFVARQKLTREMGANVNATVIAAMRQAGVTTGDPKRDIAIAADYTNNPVKLNTLRDKLRNSNPELAGRLEVVSKQYRTAKDELGYHEANTKGLEEASGVNFDNLYKEYKKNNPTKTFGREENLNKDQFISVLRSRENNGILDRAFSNSVQLNKAMSTYNSMLDKGAEKVRTSKTQLNSFNPIQPMSNGYLKQATDLVEGNAKSGMLRLRVLGEGNDKVQSLADIMEVKASKLQDATSDDAKKMKATGVMINRNYVNGKPTVTITQPDGTQRVAVIESGIDPNMIKEATSRSIDQSMSNRNSDMARSQAADTFLGIAESTMQMSLNEIKSLSPSSVKYPINDMYEVRVKPGGPEGKQVELYIRGGGLVKKFSRTEDMAQAIGYDEYQRTRPKK